MKTQVAKIDNEGILKNVQSLLTERFYVPKYQRGYRWKKKQINDLLNDIDRFIPSNDEGKNSWYCLQPLVVKQGNNDEGWRLIDGQQRLTTIRIILFCLNTRFPEDEREPLFSIKYETREKNLITLGISDWLEIVNDKRKADANIDFTHIYEAYQYVKDWVKTKRKNPQFRISNFREKLLFHCKFIWYDIDQNGQNKDKEEDVFIRLNDGKIPLTNSELIKALFLNSSNFVKDKNEEEIRLRQIEISTQWDNMEQELSNDEFWYFINGKENDTYPRIEYLFDVISQKPQNADDEEYTFRYFQTIFERKSLMKGDKLEFVNRQWENILNTFLILKEWFNDKEYYHLIGYLLCMDYKNKIAVLLNEYTESYKDIFREELFTKVKKSINWNGVDNICYGDYRARRVLLLHNVVTMQHQVDKTSRFSFFQYIGTKDQKGWDIEHIQARAEKIPEKEQHRKDWFAEVKSVITDNTILDEINNFSDWNNTDKYDKLFEKVNEYFERNSALIDENLLSNLALLDAGTNRGYGNEFYPIKRKTILKKDKIGIFIPVCTKKVFLKYYTTEVANMTFWSEDDRSAYLNDIVDKLKSFISNNKI